MIMRYVFCGFFLTHTLLFAAAEKDPSEQVQATKPCMFVDGNAYHVRGQGLYAYNVKDKSSKLIASLNQFDGKLIQAGVIARDGSCIVGVGNLPGKIDSAADDAPYNKEHLQIIEFFFGIIADETEPQWQASDPIRIFAKPPHEPAHTTPIHTVCVTRKKLFSASTDAICRWALKEQMLEIGEPQSKNVVTIATDDQELYSVYTDGFVRAVPLEGGKARWLDLQEQVVIAAFHTPAKILYSVTNDAHVTVIDTSNLKVIKRFTCPTDVRATVATAVDTGVVVGDMQGDLYLYDLRVDQARKIAALQSAITYCAYDHDKDYLVSFAAGRDGIAECHVHHRLMH